MSGDAFIDKVLGKAVSRKLLAWVVAGVLAAFGHVTSGDWVTITMVYIGSQAAVDGIKIFKG